QRTVSCYSADKEGLACGVCDACRIRKSGFAEAGITDPTRYQNLSKNKLQDMKLSL
ncbi:MAG: 7-cyano-7-deazaguanine synthase, partial [Methylococcales bacterium]|nr:7-cyano-7-deazaguanine synthase [Methylococcales bacterium]